jgi:hypothetical protein
VSAPAGSPPLGFIRKQDRTAAQHRAHARAEAAMPRHHALPVPALAAGQKVCLYDAWKDPRVVKDVGFVFPRFHQLTGSCVGAGGGQALFSLIAVQRCLSTDPTVAFLPFWPFDYGRCRFNEGDHGQGEGAMGSSFADTVVKEGVIAATGPNADPNLPPFQDSDGLVLTNSLEMQWSDGGSQTVAAHLGSAKAHPVGAAAPCRGPADVKAAILNGYPVTFACNNYIGHASVQGSGADAAVVGYWDGSGGHQQSVHAVWENPTLGTLYWVQNNWPGSTYPADPAGGPVCGCWVKEEKVAAAFRLDAEVYALSHLSWFPAQPDVMDWSSQI